MRALVLTAALLAGAAGLAACGDDEPADLAPVAGDYDAGARGDRITVELPVGALAITFGDGADAVADDQAADGAEHDAPDGHEYVAVSASLDRSADDGVSVLSDGAVQPVDLRLELDGRSAEVAAPYAVEEGRARKTPTTTWIPMTADERDELSLVVSYDGLEQRFDAAGKRTPSAADAYYDETAGRGDEQDCGKGWETGAGRSVEVGCKAVPTFTPYLPGVGWAGEGRAFVAVDIRMNVVDVRIGGRSAEPEQLRLATTLDDGEAVEPAPEIGARPAPDTLATLVTTRYFDLPAGEDAVLRLDAHLWGVDARREVPVERAGPEAG